MPTYQDQTITYQATLGTFESFKLAFPVRDGGPSIAEFDAIALAFFDELEVQQPGYVSFVSRTIDGQVLPDGNFWPVP